MKFIPLTQGQEAIVDDHWHEYLMQWKWYARWDKTTQSFYASRHDESDHGKMIHMHRVVSQTPDGMICDHIHHNTLDNREEELRNVTPSQSRMNRRMQKNNPTGVAGVSINPGSGNYRAQLKFEGKKVLDKTFNTLEEATQARINAEKKYFGEFANTDF